jgi:hypothetical protein
MPPKPTLPFPNTYHLRHVSPTSPRPCIICHKPSTSVLITPSSADFFYTCPGHLKDPTFCSPDPTEHAANLARAEAKRKEKLEAEKKKVIAEWEAKRKERAKKKESKKASEQDDKADKKDDKKDDEVKKKKLQELDKESTEGKEVEEEEKEEEPRIFNLKP